MTDREISRTLPIEGRKASTASYEGSTTAEHNVATQSGQELFPMARTILEREVMEFRPFGLDEQGHTIRDLSGMSIRAVVVHLESSLARGRGASAGSHAVEDLCRLLNQR